MIKFLREIFERSKFSRNTTPKIVSIIFSLVLWLYVMGEVNPETETALNNLDVELMNAEELKSSGLVIIGQKDFKVNAKIFGRRNEIYKITRNDIKVSADLRGFQQGVNSIPLEISQPANVTKVEIEPQQIKVMLDKVVKRQKPVEIKVNGNAVNGYEPGNLTCTPGEVLVEGPESKVNSVAKVIGEINIDGVKENVREKVPIKAIDNEGKEVSGVEVVTKHVNIYLPILRVQRYTIEPQLIGSIKEGYKITKIEVEPKIVLLKGKKEELDKIDKVLTETINVDGLDKDLETEVNLKLPKTIDTPLLLGLPKVKITVEKIETKEFTFNTKEISVSNLDTSLTTNIGKLNQDIKVKVIDVTSILEDIKRSDLELIIDAKQLSEGTHWVDIKINKKMEFEGLEIMPKQIELKVYKKDINEKEEDEADKDSGMSDKSNNEEEPGN